MVKAKRKSKRKAAGKDPDKWHLKLAFALGKGVKKVSRKIPRSQKPSGKRPGRKKSTAREAELLTLNIFEGDPDHPLTPIFKELKAVFDISGLTAALEEMNRISLRHSDHPVVNRFVATVNSLSPAEQELLSRKFIERLRDNLSFNNTLYAPHGKMSEEDCEKISGAFIEAVSSTLEDAGISEEDRAFLQKISDDVTRPLNELVQFYLHPKTFSQKVKRLWRMQRLIIKFIKLVHLSRSLALKDPDAFTGAAPLRENFDPSRWLAAGASVHEH